MTTILLVFASGAIGAPARYLTDRFVQRRLGGVFPWGTLTVNVTGSFLLGFLLGLQFARGLPDGVTTLLGTGFCGAFTTFSTFGYETVRLLEEGSTWAAGVNAFAGLLLGVPAAVTGLLLAGVLG